MRALTGDVDGDGSERNALIAGDLRIELRLLKLEKL